MFLLEEDEYEGMFITQSDPKSVEINNDKDKCNGESEMEASFLDLGSAEVAAKSTEPVYEDISDFEDFDLPSSQPIPSGNRCVDF